MSKQKCPRCGEMCSHGFCGRCERVLEQPSPAGEGAQETPGERTLRETAAQGLYISCPWCLSRGKQWCEHPPLRSQPALPPERAVLVKIAGVVNTYHNTTAPDAVAAFRALREIADVLGPPMEAAPERAALVESLMLSLREALAHVPESRSHHKRFIDEAAGSPYELVEAEWYQEAQEVLREAAAALKGEP